MLQEYPREWRHSYFLTAGESDAEGLMPLTLITERVIETATEHANALGIGYTALLEHNVAWVLSRLSIEMRRYPRINERYTFTTWIEGYNRHFSERNFVLTSDDTGEVLGYMRSVWAAIDISKRTVADLSVFDLEQFPVCDRLCDMERPSRILPPGPDAAVEEYTFRYCDLDLNRHVNTVRYLTLFLNFWTLDFFDRNMIARIDLSFIRECRFGDKVELRVEDTDNMSRCEIVREGTRAVSALIRWIPRPPEAHNAMFNSHD